MRLQVQSNGFHPSAAATIAAVDRRAYALGQRTDNPPLAPTILRQGLSQVCRLTVLDRIAFGFLAAFAFLTAASALCAWFVIGDAPSARLWSFFWDWTAIAFAVGVAGPWLACRMLHACMHVGT